MVTGVTAKRARAQTGGIRPIAISTSDTRFGHFVGRVYPQRGRNNFIVMLTTPEGERWFRIALPQGIQAVARRAQQAGRFRVGATVGDRVLDDVELSWQEVASTRRFSMQGGVAGPGTDGEVIADPDDPNGGGNGGGGGDALGFFGFLLGCLAILAGLTAYAIHEGYTVGFSVKTRGPDVGLDFTAIPPSEAPDEGGFMHDPICDTWPLMNC